MANAFLSAPVMNEIGGADSFRITSTGRIIIGGRKALGDVVVERTIKLPFKVTDEQFAVLVFLVEHPHLLGDSQRQALAQLSLRR